MEDLKELKKGLRRKVASLKKMMTEEEKLRSSDAIMSSVERIPEFMAASTVLLYYALPDEVRTEKFIRKWHGKKTIALPVVSGDDLVLKKYDPDFVKPGYMGIPEPTEQAADIPAEAIGFAVIPGVAFDCGSNRLGRGKGFYDRLIPSLRCMKAGVAYDCQIVDSVPVEQFDKPLDGVVWETGNSFGL